MCLRVSSNPPRILERGCSLPLGKLGFVVQGLGWQGNREGREATGGDRAIGGDEGRRGTTGAVGTRRVGRRGATGGVGRRHGTTGTTGGGTGAGGAKGSDGGDGRPREATGTPEVGGDQTQSVPVRTLWPEVGGDQTQSVPVRPNSIRNKWLSYNGGNNNNGNGNTRDDWQQR